MGPGERWLGSPPGSIPRGFIVSNFDICGVCLRAAFRSQLSYVILTISQVPFTLQGAAALPALVLCETAQD